MAALLAALSSAIWGTSDFVGGLAARRLPAVAVVAWSQVAGLVTAACVVLVTDRAGGSAAWVPWAVIAGACGAVGLIAFYTALATGTMGVVSPIAALGAVVPVVGGVVGGDAPSGVQYAGIAVGLAGAVLASRSGDDDPGASSGRGRSVALAALAGLMFGIALLCIQRGARSDPLLVVAGMRATSVTAFLVLALVLRTTGGVGRRDLPVLAAVGVGDVGANLLFALASTRGLDSVVAVLGALYPVATVLLGALVLGERMQPVQRAGVTLALVGVVLLASA